MEVEDGIEAATLLLDLACFAGQPEPGVDH
jgi:hypothetical protein